MTFSIASGNAKNNFRKTRRPGAFSMCPRLQKCFWILLLIWAIYLLGVIATAVQIHKLDPTTATENTSLETKKEVSVHAAIQNTRHISPEELMKQKQEELEREKERTIHKEGEVNSKELAKTLRKETADKKDEVEKDKKKDKDTGRKAKEEKKTRRSRKTQTENETTGLETKSVRPHGGPRGSAQRTNQRR